MQILKLEQEMGWISIEKHADFLSLCLFQKILCGYTQPLVRKCMPTRLVQIQHNTRNRRIFQPHKSTSVGFSNTFFLIITKKFEQLPTSCRNKSDKDLFKQELKLFLCPNRYKFLSRGTKMGCKLLTQIRVGRSYLNSHGFTVGKSLTPYCNCNNSSFESPSHYFLDCTLHAEEQLTRFNTFWALYS